LKCFSQLSSACETDILTVADIPYIIPHLIRLGAYPKS
jgi:hypothetical protein